MTAKILQLNVPSTKDALLIRKAATNLRWVPVIRMIQTVSDLYVTESEKSIPFEQFQTRIFQMMLSFEEDKPVK